MPYLFEVYILLVMQKRKLFAIVVFAPLVLVAQEDDGLENGLRGGQFLGKAVFSQMIKVVVAQCNDAVFVGF